MIRDGSRSLSVLLDFRRDSSMHRVLAKCRIIVVARDVNARQKILAVQGQFSDRVHFLDKSDKRDSR